MAGGEIRKRYAVLGVSSLILVAMVVAVTIGTQDENTDTNSRADLASSQKAVQNICAPTNYKQTCINTLSTVNSTDPKELIGAAFKITVDYLNRAAENSTVLKELESDPKTKLALDSCKELALHAVDDLQKSYDQFETFDINGIEELLDDLQVWLSAAITYQETCLDGFDNITGAAGEKMRKALNASMELTSNGLAMINEISSVFSSLDIQSMVGRRRLLSGHTRVGGDELPGWIDEARRRLLRDKPKKIKADVIVAKDGTAKYRTINEALKDIPEKGKNRFVIYIKEGVYEEKVTFTKNHLHVTVIGDGPTKTRITGSLNFIDGTPTYHTATVVVMGDYFIAKDIGIENSAGPDKHQAVALRVSADKVVFYNCHMDGYQDTLYAHTYRQFYRNCKVTGTIDFVFGDSAGFFQNCTLEVRKPLDNQQNIVTAQGRKDVRQPTGLVLQNCSIVAAPEYYPHRFQLKSYLGRPWKEFSRTIIMESFLDDLIQPEGWLPWNADFGLQTLFYTEFNNRGPAAKKNLRVKWPGVKELPVDRVERFVSSKFVEGNKWVKKTKVPYEPGFIFPPPEDNPNVKYSPQEPEETKDLGKKRTKEAYKFNANATANGSAATNGSAGSDSDSDSGSSSESGSGSKSDSGSRSGSKSGSHSGSGSRSKSDSGSLFPILVSPSAAPEASPPGRAKGLPNSNSSHSVYSWIMGSLGY